MSLYPAIKAYAREMLPVSAVHTLSVRQYGNPTGKSALFVHGGPGGGCDDKDARRFDPEVYRIVLFDQRGSGESTPASCLEDNTTQHLIQDIETIREHLKIENQWDLVFGGSWGELSAPRNILPVMFTANYPLNSPASFRSLVRFHIVLGLRSSSPRSRQEPRTERNFYCKEPV